MKRISLVLLLAGIALIYGGCCTSLVLPKDQTNFPGIAELATNSPLPGPLRLFLIHGMSQHLPDWGEGYLKPLAKDLGAGWSLDPLAVDHPAQWSDPSNTFVGNVRVYLMRHNGATRIVVYQLTWSPLTDLFKSNRFQSDLTLWRPLVNQDVRSIVDSNLSDVVLYLSGFDSNVLNKTVTIALTNFYSGEWDPEPATKAAIPESPVAVITESLGSLMFIDGLRALAPQSGEDMDAGLANFLKNSRMVFMMANQLNLLEMPPPEPAGPVPGPGSSQATETDSDRRPNALRAFLRLRYNAMHPHNHLRNRTDETKHMKPPPAGSNPFFFVAFNDPYDVLSYKITSPDIEEYAQVQWAAIDNFAPRNACDWFGLYESPAKAHDGYKDNSHVVALVVNGYHMGKNPKLMP
jgi:hypothetical protein